MKLVTAIALAMILVGISVAVFGGIIAANNAPLPPTDWEVTSNVPVNPNTQLAVVSPIGIGIAFVGITIILYGRYSDV